MKYELPPEAMTPETERARACVEYVYSAVDREGDMDEAAFRDCERFVAAALAQARREALEEVPSHDCEFVSNPEKGSCDWHIEYVNWMDDSGAYDRLYPMEAK